MDNDAVDCVILAGSYFKAGLANFLLHHKYIEFSTFLSHNIITSF